MTRASDAAAQAYLLARARRRRAAAGGGGLTPANLPSGPADAWFDTDLGIIFGISPAVHTWQDQSGNGYHAIQSNVARQPVFEASAGPGGRSQMRNPGTRANMPLPAIVGLSAPNNFHSFAIGSQISGTTFFGQNALDYWFAGGGAGTKYRTRNPVDGVLTWTNVYTPGYAGRAMTSGASGAAIYENGTLFDTNATYTPTALEGSFRIHDAQLSGFGWYKFAYWARELAPADLAAMSTWAAT